MKKVVIILILTFFNIIVVNAKEKVEFSSCVDGDTIKIVLENKVETLRLLAVDTPESVHPKKKVEYYGKEASDFTCNKVKNSTKLEIEYDENSDKKDKYDRLLVWLFVDGKLFQQELVSEGYAKVAYLYGDYKYTDLLKESELIAKEKNIGIWNEEEKESYNESNNIIIENTNTISNEENELEKLTMKEIVFILLVLLIITLVGSKKSYKKTIKILKKLSK